ncbi:MAG: sigma-70 factor domain-containing protein, partial [Gammaproteobacteria bacterium]
MITQNKSDKENLQEKVADDLKDETSDVEDVNLSEDQDEDKDNDTDDFSPGVIPQKDLDATRMYLNEIGFSPLLTAKEEVFYGRKAQKGDEEARKRMIESNLRLV